MGGDWYTAIDLGDLPSSLRIVDTQLGYAADVDADEGAIVAIGRDVGGNHWLGTFYNPDDPDGSNWFVSDAMFQDPALRDDPGSEVEYRLLNNRIDGNTHRQFLAQPMCCEELTLAKDRGRTILPGTYTWTIGVNPLGCGIDSVAHIATELRIAAGAHVSATNIDLRFGPNAELVIEPGGSFVCDSCLLTSACPDLRWAGIDVQGAANQNQSLTYYPTYQARLILKNSTVENAVIGAKAGDSGFFTVTSSQPGGVINCYSTTFKNCVRGVKFAPYRNYGTTTAQNRRNRSSFSQCVFTVDEEYLDDQDFRAHADLWKVDGINFLGCTFNNLRTDIAESDQLGMGISSLDANYTVKRYCPGLYGDCGHDAVRSSFTGLDHGIHARTSGKSRAFSVEYSDFNNNICGVLTEGVVGARIVYNEFVLGNRPGVTMTGPLDIDWEDQHRGIYTLSSFGFDIDDNHLVEAEPASNTTEGIVIGYSRGHNDLVFRNSCEGIDDAYVGEGICADPEQKPIVGLQFICNENNNNGYNIWNRMIDGAPLAEQSDHTIRTLQGTSNRPAGNTFDRSTSDPLESDLHSNTNLNAVLYKFWGAGTSTDPLDVDVNYFSDNVAQYLPPDNCINKFISEYNGDDDGMILSLNNSKLMYGNTRYQYDQLIDGGSTDEVVLEIMSSWPNEAWALRSFLLGRSPHLSTVALQEMVSRHTLPQAMQVEVMTANPAATRRDGFIRWVRDNAPVPFPEYMLAQVTASWDDLTYRTTLEEQMGEHHANMTQAANALLQYYAKDTVGEPLDSLRWVWQQVRTPAARYAEALTYIASGDYAIAADVVDHIPLEHDLKTPQMVERQRMLDIIGLLGAVALDDRTDAELSTQEQDDLESLIAEAHDRPAVWAQNLLCYAYDRCRAWPTGGDGTDWRAMVAAGEEPGEKVEPTIWLAPNPASVWCAVNYTLVVPPSSARLEVVDVTGRSVASTPVLTSQGQWVLDTRNMAPGNYAVRLVNNGAIAGAEPLQVKD